MLVARESGLELSIRGGGHSLAGHGTNDGGIVLDLGAMKGIHIDPDRRLAWAQPGLTAREYTTAAAAHGLATPFGDTGSVGIAGLTLGGGIGWLARKHGLAIDALVSVEIVTADGRVVTASEESHPDLFWAVRGGGGNFGVVTRFQYRLYPVGEIFGGALFMPATRDVLRSLVPIASSAPDELTTISFLMALPPAPFVPAELVGTMSLAVMFVWSGDPADGPAAIAPFREVATPLVDLTMAMPYPGIYALLEQAEQRSLTVHRSRFLSTLDDAAIDAILDALAAPARPPRWSSFACSVVRWRASRPTRRPSPAATRRSWRSSSRPSTTRPASPPSEPGPTPSTRRWGEQRRRVHELPRGRGRRSDPVGLPGGYLRSARRCQAPLRPEEPVPHEPEHPPGDQGLTDRAVPPSPITADAPPRLPSGVGASRRPGLADLATLRGHKNGMAGW